MYPTVILTPENIKLAIKKAEEINSLRNSVTKGDGSVASQMGEIASCRYFDSKYGYSNYDWDFLYSKLRVEVKTRRTTVEPLGTHNAGTFDFNTKQDCDIYLFTRIKDTQCWLVGWMEKSEFFRKARYYRAGDIDPDTANWTKPFVYKSAGWHLYIAELHSVKELKPDEF